MSRPQIPPEVPSVVDGPLDLPVATAGVTESSRDPVVLRLMTGRLSPRVTLISWAVFACALAVLCGQFWQGINPQDEGEMLTYPWLIAGGRMPYVHIWMMYPPGSFLLLAGLVKLGIPGLLAERALGVVTRVLFVLLLNRAVTGSWRRVSWIGLPLSFSLVFLTAEISIAAYAWIVGLPIVLAALLLTRCDRLWLAAVTFGIASVFRLEYGVAGLVALFSLAALDYLNGNRRPGIWHPPLALVSGLAAFYLCLDLMTAGRALQDMIVQPIAWIEPYRRVSLVPPLFGPLGVPAALTLFLGPPTLALLGLKTKQTSLVATNLAVCVLLPQVIQDADWGHLFGVAALGVPWVLLGLSDLAAFPGVKSPGERAVRHAVLPLTRLASMGIVWVGTTVALWYSVFVLAYALAASPLSPVSGTFVGKGHIRAAGSWPHLILARSATEAHDERQVISYVHRHAARHNEVFIAPSDLRRMDYNMTVLYYGLNLNPASMYLEADPGLETRKSIQQAIIAELSSNDWVILWNDAAQRTSHPLGPPVLERYIHRHYHTLFVNRTFQLLRRAPTIP